MKIFTSFFNLKREKRSEYLSLSEKNGKMLKMLV